jgi:hypothetical protein
MVKQDGAELRKQRIQQIARSILKALGEQNPLSLSQTLTTLQYDTGLTEEKLIEYLELMSAMGQFVLDKADDRISKKLKL